MGASGTTQPQNADGGSGACCAPQGCPVDLKITPDDRDALGLPEWNHWWFLSWFHRALHALRRDLYFALFHFLSQPALLWLIRALARIARRIHPVPRIGRLVVPLRAKDLRNALERTEDLNGAEDMSPRLPAGENVLAIDWPRRHTEERTHLERALDCDHAQDHARIRRIVRARMRSALPSDRSGMRALNIARMCEDVTLDVAQCYLGIGVPSENCCQRDHMRPIVRKLASQVFQGPVPGSIEERDARLAGDRMIGLAADRVDAAIKCFKGQNGRPKSPEDWTITDRLIQQLSDDTLGEPTPRERHWVIRNMATLTVFGSVTTARAMTQAIYQICLKPDRWNIACRAARDYVALAEDCERSPETTDDRTRARLDLRRNEMLLVVFEALRWHPMLPMLGIRTVLRDTLLAPDTCHRTRVRGGSRVLPLLLAAMHDGDTFRNPGCFCPKSRNKDDYLHFGAGPHECVGRHMAEAMMIEIAAAFFSDEVISAKYRRCDGIEYDGPAVARLRFERC